MQKLSSSELFSLEQYARQRPGFRTQVLEHKSHRRLAVGPNCTWCFEDRLTVQYQVQEMLRIERVFEEAGILDELSAYNPLIPDGSNWKATLLVEFPDPQVRKVRLAELKGIEARCWMQVAGHGRVFAVADEDMERENDEKTSAVHFLRFELSPAMVAALKEGAALAAGVDHPHYTHTVDPVAADIRKSLIGDLD